MRKVWYLLAILLVEITGATHVGAQNGCSILDLKVNHPSPVIVNQTFALAISIIVGCTIDSYVRSDITATFGSLTVRSSLIDQNATVARTGTYVHRIVLTAIGNWSLDGEMYIMGTVSQSPLAVSTYHYNINVAPEVPLTNNQTVTSESVCQTATTTLTQSVNFTVTQTTSFTGTVWVENSNSTTVTSTITQDAQLISPEAIYSVAAVMAVLFLVVLIGVIIGRKTD
jgi:hypothetical protein